MNNYEWQALRMAASTQNYAQSYHLDNETNMWNNHKVQTCNEIIKRTRVSVHKRTHTK